MPNDSLKTAADSIARQAREAMRDSVVYEPADSIVVGARRHESLRLEPALSRREAAQEHAARRGDARRSDRAAGQLLGAAHRRARTRSSRQFALVADPRVKTTPAELARQFALATNVRDRITDVVDGATRIEDIQSQLDQRVSQSKDQAYASRVADAVEAAAREARGDSQPSCTRWAATSISARSISR